MQGRPAIVTASSCRMGTMRARTGKAVAAVRALAVLGIHALMAATQAPEDRISALRREAVELLKAGRPADAGRHVEALLAEPAAAALDPELRKSLSAAARALIDG